MSGKKNNGRPSAIKSKLHVVAEDPATYVPGTEAGRSLWAALMAHPDSSAAELAIAAGIGKSTAPKLLTQWQTEGRVTKTPGIARGGTRVADRWAIGAPIREVGTEPIEADQAIADRASAAASADTPGQNHTESSDDVPDAPVATEPRPVEQPTADTATADALTAPAATEHGAETGAAGSAPTTPPEKKSRLSKGALHGLVEDVFHEHPGEPLGPSAISTKLHRSSGAVANACVRLVEKGVLVRTQDSPKRYALATQD